MIAFLGFAGVGWGRQRWAGGTEAAAAAAQRFLLIAKLYLLRAGDRRLACGIKAGPAHTFRPTPRIPHATPTHQPQRAESHGCSVDRHGPPAAARAGDERQAAAARGNPHWQPAPKPAMNRGHSCRFLRFLGCAPRPFTPRAYRAMNRPGPSGAMHRRSGTGGTRTRYSRRSWRGEETGNRSPVAPGHSASERNPRPRGLGSWPRTRRRVRFPHPRIAGPPVTATAAVRPDYPGGGAAAGPRVCRQTAHASCPSRPAATTVGPPRLLNVYDAWTG
jgi:hypothetical protein